ncbi:MAG: DUF418 domain-containing protein [Brevundimonas sp.]|nr:MAG: DUF418 domain-containing protein [Brevundimonas sp.]
MTDHTVATTGPTAAAKRIAVLDVLRGIAVCGILPVNIIVMGAVGSREGRTFPMRLDADWIAWSFQHVLLQGPMRGLFTLLFGAGMLLMLRQAEGPDGRAAPVEAWSRRCLALLLFGMVQFAVFLWPGEILWTYGIAGMMLLAFRSARPRVLWAWAIVIMIGLSAFRTHDTAQTVQGFQAAAVAEIRQAAGEPLTEAQQGALDSVQQAVAANHPTQQEVAAQIDGRTGWSTVFQWSWEGWAARHLGAYSWWGVAESLGFMLVGMALYRSGFLTGEARPQLYWLVLIVGCGLGLLVRGADFVWAARTGFEIDVSRVEPAVSWARSLLFEPARLALTLGYVSMVVLIVSTRQAGRQGPLQALGRMALTAYCLQSILTSLLFYGFGFVGRLGYASLLGVCVTIWIITALFSIWWLRSHALGPAEWLLRSLTYGRRKVAGDAAVRL